MVSSNYPEGPRGDQDIALLLTEKGPLTALGNITTGLIRTSTGPLVDPWKPLNLIAA